MEAPAPAAQPAAAPAPWLEREVWLACAGPFAFLPSIDTQVYYYPRGHSDQCRGHNIHLPADAAIPCTVYSVQLGYHADSDDPYALITLQPDQGPAQPAAAANQPPNLTRYYVRQLSGTAMDRSPFPVPQPCARSLFPVLSNDNPSQDLRMLDVHGRTYEFKQRLRGGTNTLTTAWKDYFEEKKLKLFRDAVVFIRRADGQLLIGSRRGGGPSIDRAPSVDRAMEMILHMGPAEEAALRGDQFTVRYYPWQGWAFVVPRKQVDDALQIHWQQGMKVRMNMPVDAHELRSSTTAAGTPAFYDGVVSNVKNDLWCKLQVDWKEPSTPNREELREGPSTPNTDVNIWQVEAMEPSSNKRKHSELVLLGKKITPGVVE